MKYEDCREMCDVPLTWKNNVLFLWNERYLQKDFLHQSLKKWRVIRFLFIILVV